MKTVVTHIPKNDLTLADNVSTSKYYTYEMGHHVGFVTRSDAGLTGRYITRMIRGMTQGRNGVADDHFPNETLINFIHTLITQGYTVLEFDNHKEFFTYLADK